MSYHWFTDDEVKGLDHEFVMHLDAARSLAGVPFIITSGLRTVAQNTEVGGVSHSAHLKGLAVDLRARDSVTRYKIIEALLQVGFKRIVVYQGDGHIHVDQDLTLPYPIFAVLP